MNILRTYRQLIKEFLNQDTLDEYYRFIDREAAKKMREAQYGSNAIKSAIYRNCPYAGRLARISKDNLEKFFAEILPSDIASPGIEASREASDEIYRETKEAHAGELELVFRSADKKSVSQMLDMGFLERDIYEAYKGNSMYAAEVSDKILSAEYEDSICREVAEDREEKSHEEFGEAKKAYQNIMTGNEHKYAGSGEKFAVYHNGKAALKLLQGGFLAETVREVLRENIKDEDVLDGLMTRSLEAKLAYHAIREAPSSDDAENLAETYQAFAQGYMQRHNLTELSFEDDCQIVQELRDYGITEEFLPKALSASPVGKMPGRSLSAYTAAVLDEHKDSLKKTVSKEEFVEAEEIYKAFIITSYKELVNRGLTADAPKDRDVAMPKGWRSYYDALAVKKLIACHIPDSKIRQILQEASPDNQKHDNYAYWMVDKAKRVIKREQDLLKKSSDTLPEGKGYAELTEMGITPKEIYRSLLAEKLVLNPSLAGRLYEESVDKDMAESCLVKYPDFDQEALAGILAESPRAVLVEGLGIHGANRYAENVMKEAESRLATYGELSEQENLVRYEYNRQRGLAYQGIEANGADPAYQCGRIALTMLIKGFSPLDIRQQLMDDLTPGIPLKESPEKFADDILTKVQEVFARLNAVKEWQPKEAENAGDEYLNALRQKYGERNSLRPSQDIEIIRDMLIKNRYGKKEILEAVMKHSPLAIEPGRDSTYVTDYIFPRAQNEAIDAQDKLRAEKPMPREDHAADLAAEYAYQREQLQKRHPLLPYSVQMDQLAAAALLQEGFLLVDVVGILDRHSPIKDSQSDYGRGVAIYASRKYVEEHYESHGVGHSERTTITRERVIDPAAKTITTTTEKITETTTTV